MTSFCCRPLTGMLILANLQLGRTLSECEIWVDTLERAFMYLLYGSQAI
jgi:hypothetical protein